MIFRILLSGYAKRSAANDGVLVVVGWSLGSRNGLAGAISIGGEGRRRAAAGVANDALLGLDGISDEVGREVGVGRGVGGVLATLGRAGWGIAGAIVAIVGGRGRGRGGVHDVAVPRPLLDGLAAEMRSDILGRLARADAAHALGGAVATLVGGEVDDAGESHEMMRPILVDKAELPHTRAKGNTLGIDIHHIALGRLGFLALGLGAAATGNTGTIATAAASDGEGIHKCSLEKLDRFTAQPVPEGRTVQLLGVEAEKPRDGLRHEEDPAGRVEDHDEVGDRPEDLLLPPKDGVLLPQLLDELLLPLAAELGRLAVGRPLRQFLLLDVDHEGVGRPGEADRGGMRCRCMVIMLQGQFRGADRSSLLGSRGGGSSNGDIGGRCRCGWDLLLRRGLGGSDCIQGWGRS